MDPIDNKADALHMIGSLVMRLGNGTPLSAEQHEYLLESLRKMLARTPGDIAFGIKQPGRGNKKASQYDEQFYRWSICAHVQEHMRAAGIDKPNETTFQRAAEYAFLDPHQPPVSQEAPVVVNNPRYLLRALPRRSRLNL